MLAKSSAAQLHLSRLQGSDPLYRAEGSAEGKSRYLKVLGLILGLDQAGYYIY